MKHLLLNFLLGEPAAPAPVPVRRDIYVRRFLTVCRWVAKFRFASLDLQCDPGAPGTGGPVVLYSNHPSFWDPVVCALVSQSVFPSHHVFAPIDAVEMKRHFYFRGLGFFGVEQATVRGVKTFLKVGEAVLNHVERPLLAITPEGRFTKVEDRPVRFRKGLATLLARSPKPGAIAVPLALEYRQSEGGKLHVFALLGPPVQLNSEDSRGTLNRRLEGRLEETMDRNARRIEAKEFGRNLLEAK